MTLKRFPHLEPSTRSLRLMLSRGYVCGSTELISSWGRKDLFGFADLCAAGPGGIIFIQATDHSNVSHRITKIKTECLDAARVVLQAGGKIEVHGWEEYPVIKKQDQREPRLRVEEITLDMLACVLPTE